jgi:Rod binding domain-containing protein
VSASIGGLGAPAVADPLSQIQGAGALPGPAEKTDQAARQFEGLLMGLLFQTMRKTVEPSGLFGDSGQSRSTYEYLMDQAVVERAVSGGRGWGLAERLKASWDNREKSVKEIE